MGAAKRPHRRFGVADSGELITWAADLVPFLDTITIYGQGRLPIGSASSASCPRLGGSTSDTGSCLLTNARRGR
jgi:hypothetical protein